MARSTSILAILGLAMSGVFAGCRSGGSQRLSAPLTSANAGAPPPAASSEAGNGRPPKSPDEVSSIVRLAGFDSLGDAQDPASESGLGLTSGATLRLDSLVTAVIQANPNRQAAIAAWQAAAQRYPQVVALEDPMLETLIGPKGLVSDEVNGAYTIGVSQKVPWAGKRELRGDAALWEQTAAQWEVTDAELRLAEAAKLAFFQYYLTGRQLTVLSENLSRLQAYRETALAKYQTAQTSQQDVLQSDVELAQIARRKIELERSQRIAVARINTLLHRPPTCPLLPPPTELDPIVVPASVEQLQHTAVESRPDLTAMSARIQAQRVEIAAACKEFYPDLEFIARYDAFWQEKPLRPMLGLNVNVPINQERRHAAVNEQIFRLRKQCAEYSAAVDNVRNDVQAAWERVDAGRRTIDLYEQSILKSAETNVSVAQAEYVAGTLDFLRLIAAQRQLLEVQDEYYEALTEFRAGHAELERLIGTGLERAQSAPTASPRVAPPEPATTTEPTLDSAHD